MSWSDFKPADLIVMIIVVGCLLLKLDGINGTIDLILATVVAFYLSDRAREYRRNPPISQ